MIDFLKAIGWAILCVIVPVETCRRVTYFMKSGNTIHFTCKDLEVTWYRQSGEITRITGERAHRWPRHTLLSEIESIQTTASIRRRRFTV